MLIAEPPSAPTERRLRLVEIDRLPRSILIGGGLVLVVVLVAILGDLLAPFPYDQQHYLDTNLPPGGPYRFGTDEYGRDVLSRVLVGSRVSLAYGVGASLLSLLIGVPLGLWAGYKGGRVDEVLMRVLDLMMSIPPLLLGLLVLAVTPPALWKTILAIAVITAPSAARIVRSVALGLKGEEFVQAAQARGESERYTVFREILPNAWPAIIVEAGLRVTFGILLGAALSFLGLGAQPPSSDWGLMISEGRASVTIAPWVSIFPGLAMLVTVIGFNLLGGGLRDALDPRIARDYLH
ncbi:MAG: ABC transporter permease [Chloroflexi bacterium]|nr:MAG: ABC transporter permease [Chloroflexota bacterium]